jgi:hypothetical protein
MHILLVVSCLNGQGGFISFSASVMLPKCYGKTILKIKGAIGGMTLRRVANTKSKKRKKALDD